MESVTCNGSVYVVTQVGSSTYGAEVVRYNHPVSKYHKISLEVCHPRCVCENWKGYVVKYNYVN